MSATVTLNVWAVIVPGIIGFATLCLQNYTTSATAKRNRKWDLEDRKEVALTMAAVAEQAEKQRIAHTADLASLVNDVGNKAETLGLTHNQRTEEQAEYLLHVEHKLQAVEDAASIEAKRASASRHRVVADLARIEVNQIRTARAVAEVVEASKLELVA
jgi:hypothetical protein